MGTQWKRRGRVIDAMLGKSAKKGTDQLEITFQLLPNDPENEPEDMNDVIKAFCYFSDAAIPVTVKSLKALGINIEEYDWNIPKMCKDNVFDGREAILVIEEETYEGKTRDKVKFINDPNFQREAMSADEAQDFNKRLRNSLIAAAPKKGSTPAARPAAPAAKPAPARPATTRPAATGKPAAAAKPAPARAPTPPAASGPPEPGSCGHTIEDRQCDAPDCAGIPF